MGSIQFNYFGDNPAEQCIRDEFLKRFDLIYVRTFFTEKGLIIDSKFPTDFKRLFITKDSLRNDIVDLKGYGSVDYRNSPLIEYKPSRIREDGVLIGGRLAYFAGDKFPEFKIEVQSLIRKLKKLCWKDKHWKCWVFKSVGDEATVFIPNEAVLVKRQE